MVAITDDGATRGRPRYTRAELEALAAQVPHPPLAAATEDEWCGSDLLYSLLMRPSAHLDAVLQQCHDLVLRKNEPDMARSRIISDSWTLLMRAGNAQVKCFHLLFMLHRESEVQELMRQGYRVSVSGERHPLWGDRPHAHLADFLRELERMVGDTLSWPCSDHNIISVVHNFVKAAQWAYLTM